MNDKFDNATGPQLRGRRRAGPLLPLLFVLSLVAGLQVATQMAARDFAYQPVLGEHLHRLYPPWAVLGWAQRWHGLYPDAFKHAASAGALTAAVGVLLVALLHRASNDPSKANKYLHGSARWANQRDIEASGLLPPRPTLLQSLGLRNPAASAGVYVGAWQDRRGRVHYLRHNGPEHVLCYAPTRSGKGVGLVVPTLLSWPHSAVVTDLKGELWALSAGWRRKHARNKVLRFEPAAPSGGSCWNPLDEIRLGTVNEVGDVQNLSNLLVDPDGKGLETHWQKTSQALLVGLILHVLYVARAQGGGASLADIDAIMSDPERPTAELWTQMCEFPHVDGANHPVVGAAGRDMLDRPEEEAGSVLSTAKSYLALFRDPVVARNTGCSEWRVRDLMHHDDPVTLYIVTQPNDKARLRPLVRIMVNMILRLLADRLEFEGGRPKATYKHRLLMMLDEFPSLGKLEIMQESLAFVAGYGIKCYLICQDINQLKSRETGYGRDESITSNCHVQNAYPPNRIETAEHLSRLTGQTTITKAQVTVSGARMGTIMGQMSRTVQEVQRPLLTPDECLRMPGPRKTATGDIEEPGDMVVYVAGYPAIYGKQPLYFKDPTFAARAAVPAPFDGTQIRAKLAEIGVTL